MFEVSRIYDRNISPLRPLSAPGGLSSRHNFDGIVTYTSMGGKISPPAYLQLFRSGIIESVDTRMMGLHNRELTIAGGWEDNLIDAVKQYFDIQSTLGVATPVVIMLSLLNVKGAVMYVAMPGPFEVDKVDRDHLLAPEVMAEAFTVDPTQLLKPAFDAIWNACGYPYSPSYGSDGKRKGQG